MAIVFDLIKLKLCKRVLFYLRRREGGSSSKTKVSLPLIRLITQPDGNIWEAVITPQVSMTTYSDVAVTELEATDSLKIVLQITTYTAYNNEEHIDILLYNHAFP